MSRLPRIALCGPSRCGKDTAAAWLAANTPLRMGRSTSEVIATLAAGALGLTVEAAFARRHEDRSLWYEFGKGLRAEDPAFLVRTVLAEGSDIVVGVRDREEIVTARREGLVDLIVWIDRDVPRDPTLEYNWDLCDVVIANWGTLDEFHARLAALARFARLGVTDAAENPVDPWEGKGGYMDGEGTIRFAEQPKTTDAVEIMHRRYFEGKPEMMAMLAEERAANLADRLHYEAHRHDPLYPDGP